MSINVTTNAMTGSCTGAAFATTAHVYELPETYLRRMIARGLKIVTGHITWSASAAKGSAGQAFDYRLWGSRFLWMGLTPRLMVDTVAANAIAAVLPIYDPSTRKIFLAGTGSGTQAGRAFNLITKDQHPTVTQDLVLDFCLIVADNPSASGIGI